MGGHKRIPYRKVAGGLSRNWSNCRVEIFAGHHSSFIRGWLLQAVPHKNITTGHCLVDWQYPVVCLRRLICRLPVQFSIICKPPQVGKPYAIFTAKELNRNWYLTSIATAGSQRTTAITLLTVWEHPSLVRGQNTKIAILFNTISFNTVNLLKHICLAHMAW